MQALDGRVAVVTGADQPLGRGLALALGGAGAAVGLLGDPAARVLTAELASRDGRAVAVEATLADRAALEQAFATVADELGGPVRIVVHTAVPPVAFERMPFEDVDDAPLRRGVGGHDGRRARRCCRPRTRTCTTPAAGSWSSPRPCRCRARRASSPYAAAIEGQRLLAKSAARQWGPDGITVNCLAPAPEQRADRRREQRRLPRARPRSAGPATPRPTSARSLVFLAGDGAHFVTGETVGADGGVWMAP